MSFVINRLDRREYTFPGYTFPGHTFPGYQALDISYRLKTHLNGFTNVSLTNPLLLLNLSLRLS